MTDRTIDADEVQDRLPDGWGTENDGDNVVYGYAWGSDKGRNPANVPASFTIRAHEDSQWMASWATPNPLRDGLHEEREAVAGTKERCIEWTAEQAEGVDFDE